MYDMLSGRRNVINTVVLMRSEIHCLLFDYNVISKFVYLRIS